MVPPGWRRVVAGKTWPARRPRHQIDHLLLTDGVEVVQGEVLDDAGSDHRPIRARLRVT
jgi:endonuclease/exonuclease/phosphatase family metal-dependent hydrolase